MSFPVLICDDSAIARKMVKRSLPQPLSEQVSMACNGQEAIEHLVDNPVALLCLDLTMPVMDGLQVLQEIKARCLEVFVVVISGDIQPEMKRRVSELGALDFIEKPVDADRLEIVLKRFGLY